MDEHWINDIMKKEIRVGKEKITKLAHPYFEYWDFKKDPFDKDVFFLEKTNLEEFKLLLRLIGGSQNRVPYFILVIGPKWSGKTTLLKKIHETAQNEGIRGRLMTGNELTRTVCEKEIDGERFEYTGFKSFLEKDEDLDYLIIDQTEEISEDLKYYLECLKNDTKFIKSKTMVFVSVNTTRWRIFPKKYQDIFYKKIYFFPLTKEEGKKLVAEYLSVNSGFQNIFSQEALDMVSKLSYGYPGLIIDLLKTSMEESCEMGCKKLPLEVIGSIANRKGYKSMPYISDTDAKEFNEGKNRFKVFEVMISKGIPMNATEISRRIPKGKRSTIADILSRMHKENIVSKLPREDTDERKQPYIVNDAPRIAFEHRCMRLGGIYYE